MSALSSTALGWNSVTLGEVCDLHKGSTATLKAIPGQYPLVVTGAERRSSEEYQLDCEAVCLPLVSSTGHGHASINRIHFQSGKFALANIMVALVPKPNQEILPSFLHLFLSAKKDELLVPLMAGTSNVALRISDVARVTVHVPNLEEQRRIVLKVQQALGALDRAAALHAQTVADFDRLLMSIAHDRGMFEAPKEPMAQLAPLVRRPVEVDLFGRYSELGVRSFGKGTFHKPVLEGIEVGTKKLFWIKPGDLLFQIVFAWEGAVAIATDKDDGRCGSHRFLSCVCDPNKVLSEWLRLYFLSPEGLSLLGEASPGGAGRNRTLGLEKLARIQVPVPNLDDQEVIREITRKRDELTAADTFQKDADALRRSILSKAFRGDL